jgi:hypothetical protein
MIEHSVRQYRTPPLHLDDDPEWAMARMMKTKAQRTSEEGEREIQLEEAAVADEAEVATQLVWKKTSASANEDRWDAVQVPSAQAAILTMKMGVSGLLRGVEAEGLDGATQGERRIQMNLFRVS